MKVYERQFNFPFPGSYVVIYKDRVEIHIGRYIRNVMIELYFDTVEIIKSNMKVVMLDKDKSVLSIIYNAQRIEDMRE